MPNKFNVQQLVELVPIIFCPIHQNSLKPDQRNIKGIEQFSAFEILSKKKTCKKSNANCKRSKQKKSLPISDKSFFIHNLIKKIY